MPGRFRRAVGCRACGQTGFRGRGLLTESLEMTPELSAALRRGAPVDELRAIAIRQGTVTPAADGFRRAAAGRTTLGEVARVLGLR
ncbi:MAG: hypothetical protein HYZ53_27625 [Planctomycetes bacterium]|nr:hypothetical protein [Planctomycetota bacterium]